MKKKDFELIASEIKKMHTLSIEIRETNKKTISITDMFANSIATRLQETNPRFDRSRFLLACGVTE